jgi:hypothetical protein
LTTTPSSLVGQGTEGITGVDLADIRITERLNGRMVWKVLEQYNDVARAVADIVSREFTPVLDGCFF